MLDRHLISKGRSVRSEGLALTGRVHIELARLYADPLAADGWSADDTKKLESAVERLETAIAARAESRGHARVATAAQADAVDEAKRFLQRLQNALPSVFSNGALGDIGLPSFRYGTVLARSPVRIANCLTKIRPALAKIDEQTKRYFRGQSALAQLDAVKAKLDEASTWQRVTRAGLPEETLVEQQTRGEIADRIQELRRIARNTFDDQREVRAKFGFGVGPRRPRTVAVTPPIMVPVAPPGSTGSGPPPAQPPAPTAPQTPGGSGGLPPSPTVTNHPHTTPEVPLPATEPTHGVVATPA